MVTIASASLHASAADLAALQPLPTARLSASSLKSNARTSCPALARFGAIPPPMWPRPMNAILAISSQLLAAGPFRRPLLDEGGHAFLLVVGSEQPVEQPPLEANALGEAHFERGVDHFLGCDRGERRHAGDGRGGLH